MIKRTHLVDRTDTRPAGAWRATVRAGVRSAVVTGWATGLDIGDLPIVPVHTGSRLTPAVGIEGQCLLLFLNIQRAALTALCFLIAHFFDLTITTVVLIYSLSLSAHYLFSLLMTLKVIPR